jgi:polar amino acid transport system substrate-binding protein
MNAIADRPVWVDKQRISNIAVKLLEEAFKLLEDGKVQAVVYDYPVLLYHAANGNYKGFEVVGSAFNKETYGIAFSHASPIRKKVNLALLRIVENGVYDQLYNKWFGADPNR